MDWDLATGEEPLELESVEASTLAEALDVIVARRGDGSRLRAVLAASSFLVDGAASAHARSERRERAWNATREGELDLEYLIEDLKVQPV